MMAKQKKNEVAQLMEQAKIGDTELAAALRVREVTVWRWRTGKSHPGFATMKLIRETCKGVQKTLVA